ncbi:MAG: hypothetical protein HY447_03715 [Candidatus Omnitrophica bacterium]|nr:hypothetical protein [Candidatus Omnitrophota bacterium]
MLRKDPMVGMLFGVILVCDFIALALLFLAPSPPVSYVLAPIIRTFWDDQFLHYPANFLLLPKLLDHAHFVITTIIGVFLTGVVIKKIEGQIVERERVSLLDACGSVMKRYLSLIIAWLLSYGLLVFSLRVTLPIIPQNAWLQLGGAFGVSVMIQGLVVFLLPAILILNKGFFRSVWEGLRFGAKNILVAVALISLPMFFVIALSFFKILTPVYVRVYPEFVLWVLSIGILIMTVVDLWITSLATILFLKERNHES